MAAQQRTRTPRATYRLQLHAGFTFADAGALVDYLVDLGVSHLYLSPVLEAQEGSTHGYDVADPTRVSDALGGEQGLRALADTAHGAGLGLIADLVPNHVGTGFATPLWRSLLAEGREGAGGQAFDVDWDHPAPGSRGKVVLPVLGGRFGDVLDAGELAVVEEEGEYRLAYYDNRFPLSSSAHEAVRARGGPSGLDVRALDELLATEHYRLAHWRAPLQNYRRFFAINDLAAVRVELDEVFAHTHDAILGLVADGVLDGLRIDHPDGLRDPARYLQRLHDRTGGAWVVVEKIVLPGERLPSTWPVAGTTGYEFANLAVGLFVDPGAREALDDLDRELGGAPDLYEPMARRAKREKLETDLRPDLERIARLAWGVFGAEPAWRDIDFSTLRDALADVLSGYSVYRSYVDPETAQAAAEDRAVVASAVDEARGIGSAPTWVYDALEALLVGEAGSGPARRDVLARVQQLSGAVMAKGVEDTVFYRYRRLLALNEVGGEPARWGSSVGEFHEWARAQQRHHPLGMLTTATHDTKRGEDARLRLAALSELSDRWIPSVRRWREALAHAVQQTADGPAPDPQTESLVYQSAVSVWPVVDLGGTGEQVPLSGATSRQALRDRLVAYVQKACREDGRRTTWTDPDEAFESACAGYIAALLDGPVAEEVAAVAEAAAAVATVHGLSQVLLRCMAPGVPDTYQGCEGWDLSLVDPDNRRPVDFDQRVAALTGAASTRVGELVRHRFDGRLKLWVLSRTLRARASHPSCVGADASYQPVVTSGRFADHLVAFTRRGGDDALVVLAPRLIGGLTPEMGIGDRTILPLGRRWEDTTLTLDAGSYEDLLTGARHTVEGDGIGVGTVLAELPVALLARTS